MSEEKYFDGRKISNILYDEMGQMPLKIKMNGCKFRWDVFKMAYEMSHQKSLERVITTAQSIIDWVNDEPKQLPESTDKNKQP